MALEINDPIHKTIVLSDREKEITDHPYIQRLRFIRQLGFVPLVYPSATHDRFSHSLGTMHVAGLLAKQILHNESHSILAKTLKDKEKDFITRTVRLAGLLHDVGHPPFSHPSEKVMPAFSSLKVPSAWYRNPQEIRTASHEDYSVLLIAGLAEGKNNPLTREEAEIIASLIHHKKIRIPSSWKKYFSQKVNADSLHSIVRSIVSGNIDGDRMDYLLRDSHFAGVSYGHFDINWLISNLGVIDHRGNYVMSISDSGLHALEHYLFARYNMYIQVYMHKTVKCFEYFFQRALDDREIAYTIPAEREAYVQMRDATLIESLAEAARRNPRSWSAKLMLRKPAHRIARLWGETGKIQKIYQGIKQNLKPHGIEPFMSISRSKFIDLPESNELYMENAKPLEAVPLAVIRKQFGIVSAASLADYSFILKRYHKDISIGDLYVPRDQYEENKTLVTNIIKKYRTFTSSELPLKEEI